MQCDGKEMNMESFMKEHSLKNISQPTVYHWMNLLGFPYCNQCRTYYVDEHEQNDVVKYHTEFSTQYLTTYEPHCM